VNDRHADPGFRVISWGSTDSDAKCTIRKAAHQRAKKAKELLTHQQDPSTAYDVIPANYKIQRKFVFKLVNPQYSSPRVFKSDGTIEVKPQEGTTVLTTATSSSSSKAVTHGSCVVPVKIRFKKVII
jgi:hypothetical protein